MLMPLVDDRICLAVRAARTVKRFLIRKNQLIRVEERAEYFSAEWILTRFT